MVFLGCCVCGYGVLDAANMGCGREMVFVWSFYCNSLSGGLISDFAGADNNVII